MGILLESVSGHRLDQAGTVLRSKSRP